MLEKQGQTHKRCSPIDTNNMDTPVLADQQKLTLNISVQTLGTV